MGEPLKRITSAPDNKLNKGRHARSSAPSPSINDDTEPLIRSVERDIHPTPTSSLKPHVYPSTARLAGVNWTWAEIPSQRGGGEGPAAVDLSRALSRVIEERERGRSDSPSPSASPLSFTTLSEASDNHVATTSQADQAREGRIPRSFRSSAPSPDRGFESSVAFASTLPFISPISSLLTRTSGIAPPTNTPSEHDTHRKSTCSSACSTCPSPSSPTSPRSPYNSRNDRPIIQYLDNTNRPAYHHNYISGQGFTAVMGNTDEDREDGEYSTGSDGGGERYDGEGDREMMDMVRQSVTKTVTVTNTPREEAMAKFGKFGEAFGGKGKGKGKAKDVGGEKEWSPPVAPEEMKSHMITWINDKKVGERINGIKVPWEELGDWGFEGPPSDGNGKDERSKEPTNAKKVKKAKGEKDI